MNKIKQKSFLVPIILLVIISILFIVSINTYLSIDLFKTHIKADIKQLEQTYLKKEKDMIYNKVHLVNKSINILVKRKEIELKKYLQERVQTALGIAQFIYNKFKGKLSDDKIKSMIVNHLDIVRFNNHRGYYFIYDKNIVIGHAIKKYIGQDMTNFKDKRGQNLMDIKNNSLKNHKFGFSIIYFNKPDNPTQEYPKMICVARFKPLDIVIGTGEYLDNVEQDLKNLILERFSILEGDKNQYLFILDLHNIKGGDNFATMILNPNRPDLIGKKLNDSYKDAKGKEFRKEFLKGLKEKGEVYVKYWYKKPNFTKPMPKMSYFYWQKDWNWIIASGFYFDDLEKQIKDKQNSIKIYMDKVIYDNLKITIILTIIILLISVFIALKIDNTIKSYIKQLSIVLNDIKLLNMLLEKKVNKKVKELREKDNILIQQSKLAAMGEMIGNIAHQWRQPLNVLGIKNMTLYTYYKRGLIDNEFIKEYVNSTTNVLQHMSDTIDNFRDFFKPSKEKENFNLYLTIKKSIDIIDDSLKNYNIICTINEIPNIILYGYENEFSQVILNMITNAKDVINANKIKNGIITITIKEEQNTITVEIKDNAGGISNDIIDKVFDPYFTTKHQSQGTGIGLYMSKMIIEKNMGGNLSVRNGKEGAVFSIVLLKDFGKIS